MKEIIIVGLGETADIAYEYFKFDSNYDVVAFSVDKEYLKCDSYQDLPVVALEDLATIFPPNKYLTFVALASGQLNKNREKLYKKVKEMGYTCASYISSRAFVWRTVKVGENCFIFEGNVLQHGVEVGNNVVLWSGNHIGHQTKIRDNVFVTSHCVISGYCDIGENCFLGVNCTFADGVTVNRDCFIGMGSIVNRNVIENTLIKPAKSEIASISAKKLCKVVE